MRSQFPTDVAADFTSGALLIDIDKNLLLRAARTLRYTGELFIDGDIGFVMRVS